MAGEWTLTCSAFIILNCKPIIPCWLAESLRMAPSGVWGNWRENQTHRAKLSRDGRGARTASLISDPIPLWSPSDFWTERCGILLLFIPWPRAKISHCTEYPALHLRHFSISTVAKENTLFFSVAMYIGKNPIQRIVLQELWKHLPAENLGALFKQMYLPTFQYCWLCRTEKRGLF